MVDRQAPAAREPCTRPRRIGLQDAQTTCEKKLGRRKCSIYDVLVRDLEKEAFSFRGEYKERDCEQYREGVSDQIVIP